MYFRELRNTQKAWKTQKSPEYPESPEKPENPEYPEKPENPSVHPWGIEPQPKEPESFILSIKLWVHYRPLSP